MESLLLLFRLLLAGIFALAGAAKFADLAGSRKVMQDFGIPTALATPTAVGLSLLEIAIAAFLLSVQTSWYGAVAATGLLGLFAVQMAMQLAKGNAPDCHCFGQVYSEPVSKVSIARNVVFALPAIALVISGRSFQGMALTDPRLDVMQTAFGTAIVGFLVAAIAMLRKVLKNQDHIRKRIELLEAVGQAEGHIHRDEASHPNDGMPIGALVNEFEASDIIGSRVTLTDIRADGLPVLFFYVSPTCRPCEALVPEIVAWQDELAGKVKIALISSGTETENRDKFGDRFETILLQAAGEISDLIGAKWTPTAVLMGSDGRIASHAAAGDIAIRELVAKIKRDDPSASLAYFTNGHGSPQTLKIGEAVPEIAVADITGREITTADLMGTQTLVAFWSTGCSHCSAMLPDLVAWEKDKGADEPGLLVFSDGDEETLRGFGLTSPVILDEGHRTAAQLGMYGTPSAVLVNEDGVIATETAIGAPNIWSLIGKRK
jgi:thiol-disulfide isomerase/thioredoxin